MFYVKDVTENYQKNTMGEKMGKVKSSKMYDDAQEQEEEFQRGLDEYTEDFFGQENLEVDNSNVEKVLRSFNSIQNEIKEMEVRQSESYQFYSNEIEKLEKKAQYSSNCLRTFIESKNKKTMKFPNGTLSIRKKTSHNFNGKQDELLEWCQEQEKKFKKSLTKTTTKPSKSLVIKFIKETGFSPDDWEIEESTSFNVKTQGE